MDVESALWHARRNGTIAFEESPPNDGSVGPADRLVVRKYRCIWRPPYQIACRLPEGFSLDFKCVVGPDGNRRFVYCRPTQNFLLEASLGGHAILEDRGELAEPSLLTPHEARLFHQFVRSLRGYLGRTIKLAGTLHIARAGAPDSSTTDVLPEDLGLDGQQQGQRWTPSRLKDEGVRAARAAGKQKPTAEEIISYGFMVAARRNPLVAESSQVESLVRMSLFALDANCDVDAQALSYVADQVRASLYDHVGDSTEEFDRWIEDRQSNLIHRISKRSDCRLTREQVQRTLVRLGWESFKSLGKEIDVQMRAFRAALPEQLNDLENNLFERVYLARPEFGGLPLLLLHDRLSFVKPAILAIWDQPDAGEPVAVLHRMLAYYAFVIDQRRDADRRYKQHAQGANRQGRPPLEQSLTEEAHSACSSRVPIFKEIALEIAKDRKLVEDMRELDYDARLVEENEQDLVLNLTCSHLEIDEEFTVSRIEFENAARKLAEEMQHAKRGIC